MHLSKATLLLSFILSNICVSNAQEISGPYLKDCISIYSKVDSYIDKNGQSLIMGEKRNGCLFVKFTIDAKGNVTDIVFNDGAWNALSELIRSALLSTNGLWETSRLKKNFVSKLFLLPVLYNTGAPPDGWSFRESNTAAKILDKIPTIKDTADLYNITQKGIGYDFLNMTSFGNRSPGKASFSTTKETALECILLAPIELTARMRF